MAYVKKKEKNISKKAIKVEPLKDTDEIPVSVKNSLEIIPVKTLFDILKLFI